MNLLILLLFGILSIVHVIFLDYKIPKYDACPLKVLLCGNVTKPLTPIDNSTLEMFKFTEELNAVCESLGAIQHCHLAVVTDQCGCIAGKMLKNLVIFRGERDFMCIEYEKMTLNNLEGFNDTMDSWIQQCGNIVKRFETQDEVEGVDGLKKDFKIQKEDLQQERASKKFHSCVSPTSDDNSSFKDTYLKKPEWPLNLYISYCNENGSKCSCLSEQKIKESATVRVKEIRWRHFREKQTDKVLCDENYSCKMNSLFLLTGSGLNGEAFQLGCGETDALWATSSPLKDTTCSWMVNPGAPTPLAECSILIGHSKMAKAVCKRELESDLPVNAKIAMYETVNKIELKRVAELIVHSFLKHSSVNGRNLENEINFFHEHAYDIRYWCSDQNVVNLYLEPNLIHSTSKVGTMSLGAKEHGTVNGKSRGLEEKYNFYVPYRSEYPIYNEMNLISSEDGNLENGFEAEDEYSSQNYDEILDPFLSYEILNGENLDEASYLHSSEPLKSSHHAYRPYDLFRPPSGEDQEIEDQVMSTKDFEIKYIEETSPNPCVLSFECDIKDGYVNPYAEKMCPALPENISNLVNKPGRHSKESCMKMDDPPEAVEIKHRKKLQFCKEGKDVSNSYAIWNVKEPENNNAEPQQNQYEVHVVNSSDIIKMSGESNWTEYEDSFVQHVVEDSDARTKRQTPIRRTKWQTLFPRTKRKTPMPITKRKTPMPSTKRKFSMFSTKRKTSMPSTKRKTPMPSTKRKFSMFSTKRKTSMPSTKRKTSMFSTKRKTSMFSTKRKTSMFSTKRKTSMRRK